MECVGGGGGGRGRVRGGGSRGLILCDMIFIECSGQVQLLTHPQVRSCFSHFPNVQYTRHSF